MSSSLTVNDILYQARLILQDTAAERYSDTNLLFALNFAISDMRRIRPDIIALQGTVQDFPFNTTQLAQNVRVPVDDMYYAPLVAFVAGWAELADDEHVDSTRAGSLLQRFASQLMLGG